MSFVARSYPRPEEAAISLTQALIKRTELSLLDSVADWAAAQQADIARERALAQAQIAECERLSALEREQLLQAEQQALSARMAEQASQLENHYQDLRRALLDQLEPSLDQALAAALKQIGLEIDDRQRLQVVMHVLASSIGAVSGARLQLSTQDYVLRTALPPLSWPIEQDESLPPGSCRLVSPEGCWLADFDSILARLVPISDE